MPPKKGTKQKTRPVVPAGERFQRHYVIAPNGCWEWTAAIKENGYGKFAEGRRNEYKNHYAHRFSYVLHKGDIPDGMKVLHSCDNRRCVNPHHLWLGTHDENMRDMVQKGRQTFGERCFHAKLSSAQVADLREFVRTNPNAPEADIAKKYGITADHVGQIVSYRRRVHG